MHFPKSCLHCDDAPCVTVCPTGASYKRGEDGIVLVDEDKCIGCGLCAWACPYGAREMDLAAGVMKKCTLCIDRIYNETLREVDRVPSCVRTCPANARHFGDLADPDVGGVGDGGRARRHRPDAGAGHAAGQQIPAAAPAEAAGGEAPAACCRWRKIPTGARGFFRLARRHAGPDLNQLLQSSDAESSAALRCPSLSCRTSPPQGGRLAVRCFRHRQRCERRLRGSCQSPPWPRCPARPVGGCAGRGAVRTQRLRQSASTA